MNRGVAILGDALFMGTIDGHLVAVDARTAASCGTWPVAGARPEAGYAMTVAPLVVKDKVIVGPAGGDFGIRGFIAAFDAEDRQGAVALQHRARPGRAGPRDLGRRLVDAAAAAPIWMTGSYDPELNLTYWGIGNPGPDWNGDDRQGDNLYSDSVVALDPDTGS